MYLVIASTSRYLERDWLKVVDSKDQAIYLRGCLGAETYYGNIRIIKLDGQDITHEA